MKLSTKSRYGARALLELTESYKKNVVPVNIIAKNQGISERYLQNILLTLVDAGIVKSIRGKKGGFELVKAPSEITLADIVGTLEEDNGIVECVKDADYCNKRQKCVMYDVWNNLSNAIFTYMESITLEDIMRMQKEKEIGEKFSLQHLNYKF